MKNLLRAFVSVVASFAFAHAYGQSSTNPVLGSATRLGISGLVKGNGTGLAVTPAVSADIVTILGYAPLSHAINATNLASVTNYTIPVMRDDVGIIYVDLGVTCPAADGGFQVQAASGHCFQAQLGTTKPSIAIWGCKADSNGTPGNGTDNAPCLTAAANWQTSTGRMLYAPGAVSPLVYRLASPLRTNGSFAMMGDGCGLYAAPLSQPPASPGTTFYFDHAGRGFDLENYGIARLRDFCTLRNQPTPASTAGNAALVAYTPANNDFDIYVNGTDIYVNDVLTINPTNQMYVTAARYFVDGLRGQPLSIGFQTDNSQDTDTLQNYRAWPYWSQNTNVYNYQLANTYMIGLGRIDNPNLSNITGVVIGNCISATTTSAGTASKLHVNNLDCDFYGKSAIQLAGASAFTGQFTNVTTQGATNAAGTNVSLSSLLIDSTSTNVNIQLANYRSTDSGGSAVNIASPSAIVTASNFRINGWGKVTASAPAISVAAGSQFNLVDKVPDFSFGSGGLWFGGTAYSISQGGVVNLPTGSGFLTISGEPNGPVATYAFSGGQVNLGLSTYSTFVSSTGSGSVSAGQAGVPSGKFGLYYSGSSYVLYNNTGSTFNVYYKPEILGQSN